MSILKYLNRDFAKIEKYGLKNSDCENMYKRGGDGLGFLALRIEPPPNPADVICQLLKKNLNQYDKERSRSVPVTFNEVIMADCLELNSSQ